MGRWAKSIISSDNAADFEHDLLSFLGWVEVNSTDYDPDDYKDHTERVTKEDFEKKGVEEIVKWMISKEMDIEQGLFLAYHLLIRGVDVSDERLDKFISFCNEDAWANESTERRIYMQLAVELLENYKVDKTPVDIDIYYDFENYFIEKRFNDEVRNLPPVEKVIELFEKYGGIKIIASYRSAYGLYFVISHDDYNKIKGESIMGIKFITAINE